MNCIFSPLKIAINRILGLELDRFSKKLNQVELATINKKHMYRKFAMLPILGQPVKV